VGRRSFATILELAPAFARGGGLRGSSDFGCGLSFGYEVNILML
jgi:hypothetical protein